jgi:gamma-glutamyl hercynylcysteine S-oxide synthase
MTTTSQPSSEQLHHPQAAYTPEVRLADKEVLSLALMDSRNYTLAIFEAFASLAADHYLVAANSAAHSPLWTLGKIAWQHEWLTLRFDTTAQIATALPMLEDADALFEAPEPRAGMTMPPLQAIKQYLFDTLEASLESLAACACSDEALHAHRHALFFEDFSAEALHTALQTLSLGEMGVCRNSKAISSASMPILVPEGMLSFNTSQDNLGFAFDNERHAEPVRVPAFEIDASLVSWAQFADFIADGGYDDLAFWSRDGMAWLTQTARRVPLYVEQARSQVLAQRFGKMTRVDLREPVRHVTLWEAQAYARWAARRLPTEVEWAAAARSSVRQGFAWGSLCEWTGSRHKEILGEHDSSSNKQAVRGASFATSGRLRDARVRRAWLPQSAHEFVGFRTCAL